MILIANPIYDVVFKYLFEDNAVAITFLSLILKKKIVKLEFMPTELKTKIEHNNSFLTIYRIDFSAKIENADKTEELVIIEIQKARFHTDIMRFRRYLGSQYMNENNHYTSDAIDSKKKALPIISIYFLGHKLDHATAPVIKVARSYHDISKKNEEIITVKEEFIESLTHDSYIIQIPYLKQRRQTDLLKVLSVFDQDNIGDSNHILSIKEDELPEEYRPIVRRLLKASSNKEINDVMTAEDDILSELQSKDRELNKKTDIISKLQNDNAEKDSVISEKDNIITEKDSVISEKDNVITEKDSLITEKNQMLELALNLLISKGMSKKEARESLGL